MKKLSYAQMEKIEGGIPNAGCDYIFSRIWDPGYSLQEQWINLYFDYGCHMVD